MQLGSKTGSCFVHGPKHTKNTNAVAGIRYHLCALVQAVPEWDWNSTGRGEGIRGGARVVTIPDVVMGVLRVLSTWINRMEGSSSMAVALFLRGNRCLRTTPLEDLAAVA